MALAPLNKSHQVQGSRNRGQPETDRAIYQSSLPFAKASGFTRAPCPDARSVASRENISGSLRAFERDNKCVIQFSFGARKFQSRRFVPSSVLTIHVLLEDQALWDFVRYAYELERRLEEARRFEDPWFDRSALLTMGFYTKTVDGIMPSENFYGSWGRESWVKVEKATRPFPLRLARVFEYTPKIGSDESHRNHAPPDGVLSLENTGDDVGLFWNDLTGRKLVERWKAGPGRKKAWRMTPRPRLANKDRTRLLRRSQQREASFCSCSTPFRNSEFISLIRQATISPSVPKVMFDHSIAGHNRSQICPKSSVLKNAVRRFGILTPNTSRPRTRSKPFSLKAIGFVHGDGNDGGDGIDDEEDDDHSFEPGPSEGSFEVDRFSDLRNDM